MDERRRQLTDDCDDPVPPVLDRVQQPDEVLERTATLIIDVGPIDGRLQGRAARRKGPARVIEIAVREPVRPWLLGHVEVELAQPSPGQDTIVIPAEVRTHLAGVVEEHPRRPVGLVDDPVEP